MHIHSVVPPAVHYAAVLRGIFTKHAWTPDTEVVGILAPVTIERFPHETAPGEIRPCLSFEHTRLGRVQRINTCSWYRTLYATCVVRFLMCCFSCSWLNVTGLETVDLRSFPAGQYALDVNVTLPTALFAEGTPRVTLDITAIYENDS